MSRFLLLLLGSLSAYAAWILMNDSAEPTRKPIPARVAAEQLQQAWADHHTRA